MKIFKQQISIYHDYYHVVKSVYPKILDSIDSIIQCFKENRDASSAFVEYFGKGHREIHLIIDSNISCSKVNDLLSDLFISLTKYDRNYHSFDIPEIFYNYHAIHYYHQIKKIILKLDKNNMPSEDIVDYLIKYEISKHEKNECYCGESHEVLDSYKLKELLTKILDYYYSVNNSCYNEYRTSYLGEYRYLN